MPSTAQVTDPIPATGSDPDLRVSSFHWDVVVRALLFLWTILVACPIRYWPIDDSIDNTWVFAINYGAAHGLAIGRDLVWTTGPLGYLAFPMDIGNNLAQALAFQGAVWAVLIAVFWDLYYRAGLPLRNLAHFAIFFSLSAPLYWFNFMGLENLLLAGALVLLVRVRQGEGIGRYLAALVLAGSIPLIKLTGGMLVAAALVGFLADRALRKQGQLGRDAALAVSVPLAVSIAGLWMTAPSWTAIAQYWKGSMQLVSGYSTAMSKAGDLIEFAGVAEALLGIGIFLFWKNRTHLQAAWFMVGLLLGPLLISIKHGFVRQDIHVLNFFSFVGLALALIALLLPLGGTRSIVTFLVLLNFGIITVEYMFARLPFDAALAEAAGTRGVAMAVQAVRFDQLRSRLRAATDYAPEARIEPEVRALIGESPVASLSMMYSGAALDGLNLQLYPVIQRYAAFTPYLDERNAEWIRDRGPRFLICDKFTVDSRHLWAETPAMWLEVYRSYDTRLLGPHNLLLERRAAPRFGRLLPTRSGTISLANGFELSRTSVPVFWTLRCAMSTSGTLQKLLLRVPEVMMKLDPPGKDARVFRVMPEVLQSPVLGNFLPDTLPEFAVLFTPDSHPQAGTSRISFSGPGISAYGPQCGIEFLVPAP